MSPYYTYTQYVKVRENQITLKNMKIMGQQMKLVNHNLD